MMEDGRRANEAGDFAAAERIFTECHRRSGLPEARISAANMKLKMGRVSEALKEYKELKRKPSYMSQQSLWIVEQKTCEAQQRLGHDRGWGLACCVSGCDWDRGRLPRLVEALKRCWQSPQSPPHARSSADESDGSNSYSRPDNKLRRRGSKGTAAAPAANGSPDSGPTLQWHTASKSREPEKRPEPGGGESFLV